MEPLEQFTPELTPKHRVSKSLRIRQAIFIIISIVLLASVGYDLVAGDLAVWLGILAIFIGIVVGFFVGRVSAVKWHEEKEQVVSQLDIIGVIAIVVYIAFDISREWIFAHWFRGVALSTFTLAVLAGLLIGRYFGVQRSIMQVLASATVE